MIRGGHDSKMLVLYKESDEKNVIKYELDNSFFKKKLYAIRRKQIQKDILRYPSSSRMDPFSDDRSYITSNELNGYVKNFDIINLHWVAGFIDYRSFFARFAGKKPIVWRLADMNPFTGGCHYDWDCEKYSRGCGQCPQLNSKDQNDLSAQIWRRKNNTFNKLLPEQLHIVTLCNWMSRKVEKCPFFEKFPSTIIHNGVDLQVFRPKDKNLIREKLGIDNTKIILLFLAENIHVKRKGLKLLLDAISSLNNKNDYALITVGKDQSTDYSMVDEHYHFAITNEKSKLANIFNAADLFIIPSLQENFPNAVIESLACGTPVVGFNVGGIPEIIENGKNGFLVKEINAKALYDCINNIFENTDRLNRMRLYAVEKAIKNYDLIKQTSKYIELFNNLIK